MNLKILILALSTFCSQLFAKVESTFTTNYHHDKWTIQKEFGNTPIFDIILLSDNIILLTTQNGLFTFDGSNFSPYKTDLKDNLDKQLYEIDTHGDGIFWFHNPNGLIKIAGSHATIFDINAASQTYNQLALDKAGIPWVLYDSALFTLHNDQLVKVFDAEKINSISAGKGAYNIISFNHSFSKINYNAETIETFDFKDSTITIEKTLEDSQNRIWVITNTGTYIVENNNAIKLNIYNQTLDHNSQAIFEDSLHNIYLAIDQKLYIYKNNKLILIQQGLEIKTRVRGFILDKYNNIWFGTWGKGLNRLKSTPLSLFSNIIENPTVFFNHKNKDKWIASFSSDMVILKKDGTTISPQIFNPIKGILIWDIESADKDNVFVAHSKGLVKYNKNGEIIQEIPQFKNQRLTRILKEDHNNMWVLADRKVFKNKDKNFNSFIELPGLQGKKITIMENTYRGILFQNKHESYVYKNNKLIPELEIATDRGYLYVITSDAHSKDIWYGNKNNNTLVRLNDHGKSVYNLDVKLTSFAVYGLKKDVLGNLIAVGESGILLFKKEWIDFYDNSRAINSNQTLKYKLLLSPLQNNYECNGFDDAITIENNKMYITCNGGILQYNPAKFAPYQLPETNINSVLVNNSPLNFTKKDITLKPPINSLNFHYSTPFLDKSLSIKYRYKLNGIDEQWQYSQDIYTAGYIQPAPGEYKFEVQSKNSSTSWKSSQKSKLSFIVLPYFYQTNWFFLLMLSVTAFLLIVIIQFRTKRFRTQRKKLALLVRKKTKNLRKLQTQKLQREQNTKKELEKQVLVRTKKLNEQMQQIIVMENQLKQSQKMEMIGFLTSGIAHDFNNMLAIIYIESEIIKNNPNNTNLKPVNQIIQAANKCSDIIGQLLSFAKLGKQNLITTTLENALNESLALIKMALPESIKLKQTYAQNRQLVDIDLIKFHQIILNLLINARDACNNTGTITIKTATKKLKQSSCISCKEEFSGTFIELSVKDEGNGIDKKDLNNIFKPFFSTKNEKQASGIGLQVVHRYIHSLGGHILVKNRIEKGVEFALYFPVSQNIQNPKSNANTTIKLSQPTKTIHMLLVEDSQSLAKSIKQLLSMSNIDVDIANNGKEGLKKYLGKKDYYDIIVTDNDMPEMNGVTMIEKIRKINANFPIVLFTGYESDALKYKKNGLNITKVIQKPFNSLEFIHTIKEIVVIK